MNQLQLTPPCTPPPYPDTNLETIPAVWNEWVNPENEICHSDKRQEAIIKIQRAFRAYHQTKNIHITKRQLELIFFDTPQLDIYGESTISELAECVSQECNKMTNDPSKYKGKSLRLLKDAKYVSPEGTSITLNNACWLEMAEDGQSLFLLVITGEELGSGKFKSNYKAPKFQIFIKLINGNRSFRESSKVLTRFTGKKEVVEEGLEFHKLIMKVIKGTNAQFVGLPRSRFPLADNEKNDPFRDIEWEQDWFNGSLDQINKEGVIPLCMDQAPVVVGKNKQIIYPFPLTQKKIFQFSHIFTVFAHAAESLDIINQKGLVQADFNHTNLAIKVMGAEKKIYGYIFDFDFTTYIGTQKKFNHVYWDRCTQEGYVTPFADCYSLAINLAITLFPCFSIYKHSLIQLIKNDKIHDVCDLIFTHAIVDMITDVGIEAKLSTFINPHLRDIPELEKITSDPKFKVNGPYISFLNFFEDLEKLLKTDLSDEERAQLLEMQTKIGALAASFNLILKIIKKDDVFYEYLNKNEYIKNILEKGTLKDRIKIIPELEKNYYPMNKISKKIKKIQNVFKNEV